ncbi:MAG: hypothetical protein ACXABY_21340 [Candidatus Thorarchaeota archaeon]|jgi:hypothetical protein
MPYDYDYRCDFCGNPGCDASCQDRDYWDDRIQFADPGGESALRAATPDNPRNLPCPTCGRENMLTPKDRALGYQCDICARELELGF